jgi:hypothetical protein
MRVPREDRRDLDGRPAAYWVGCPLRISLLGLLLLPLLKPHPEQYEGKGMSSRILVFSLACLVVPLLWCGDGTR